MIRTFRPCDPDTRACLSRMRSSSNRGRGEIRCATDDTRAPRHTQPALGTHAPFRAAPPPPHRCAAAPPQPRRRHRSHSRQTPPPTTPAQVPVGPKSRPPGCRHLPLRTSLRPARPGLGAFARRADPGHRATRKPSGRPPHTTATTFRWSRVLRDKGAAGTCAPHGMASPPRTPQGVAGPGARECELRREASAPGRPSATPALRCAGLGSPAVEHAAVY
jgi:hypothetical protein